MDEAIATLVALMRDPKCRPSVRERSSMHLIRLSCPKEERDMLDELPLAKRDEEDEGARVYVLVTPGEGKGGNQEKAKAVSDELRRRLGRKPAGE